MYYWDIFVNKIINSEYKEAANSITTSIEKTLSNKKSRTKDLNGESNTSQCAEAVLNNLS